MLKSIITEVARKKWKSKATIEEKQKKQIKKSRSRNYVAKSNHTKELQLTIVKGKDVRS